MGLTRTRMPLISDWNRFVADFRRTWQLVRSSHGRESEVGHDNRLDEKLEESYVSQSSRPRLGSRIGRRIVHAVVSILSLLLFLIPRRGRPARQKAAHELHPLAYLDALRGIFAMIIFTTHTMPNEFRWIPQSVLRIPWLQIFFRGGFISLDVFFWISGYAVTYRIVGFIQTKQTNKVLETLASSIFRRYLRLFLPVIVVTLVTAFTVKLGLAIPPENKDSVVKEINANFVWWWIRDTAHLMNPFTHNVGWYDGQTGSKLIDPLWSISTEFRSSMIMYLFCTGTCKMSTKNRRRLLLMCIPPFMCWQMHWSSMAFLGMWFAERRQQRVQEQKAQNALATTSTKQASTTTAAATSVPIDTTKEKQDLPTHEVPPSPSSLWTKTADSYTTFHHRHNLSRFHLPLLYLSFIYSFVVAKDAKQMHLKTSFPANVINYITPPHWFHQTHMHWNLCIAAYMMLNPIDQIPLLQRPLRTPFAQYLGELSFGIYAVHFPVRWVVWDPRYVKWQVDKYGKEFDSFSHLFPGYVVMAICVLWVADAFRRLDMQVVRFCKFLEERAFE